MALVLVVGNHIGAAKPILRGWQGDRAELASKPTQQVGAAGPLNKGGATQKSAQQGSLDPTAPRRYGTSSSQDLS